MRNEVVRIIAETMGWGGCYGFNHLIHYHTGYPLKSIFKDNFQDIAYSGSKFILGRQYVENEEKHAAFCPECVKDDINRIGFSYWRRLHRSLDVCAKHNVHLLRHCPFCGVVFSKHGEGKGYSTMWTGCEGRHFTECDSKQNFDKEKLKRSVVYEEICGYEYHIPKQLAVNVLHEKLRCNAVEDYMKVDEMSVYIDKLQSAANRLGGLKGCEYLLEDFSALIFESIIFTYDHFSEFVTDVRRHGYELHGVSSFMSTYRVETSGSSDYVRDGYTFNFLQPPFK